MTEYTMGVRELRAELGRRVDVAHYQHEITIITSSGEPRAVLIPYEWLNAVRPPSPLAE